MKDKEVISILTELDEPDFIKTGQLKRHSGDIMSRLLLHDLVFSLMDRKSMEKFKKLYSEAKEARADILEEKRISRIKCLRQQVDSIAQRLSGKIAVIGHTKNVAFRT
ncbi:MAG: hypothetical protein PVH12_08900 [Candidatus Bathyarchaeota archaeon]|jgi:hypothetical protein